MTFEQLQQFMVVAKLKSFSRTAEALYVSHSTISRNMSMLEQSLGVSLMERDTRSVSLTYAGQILYQHGQELIQHIDSIVQEVQLAGMGARGNLKVTSIHYYNDRIFRAFRNMTTTNPEISLTIVQNDLAHIVQDIHYDNMDLGITFSYALGGDRDNIEVIPVARECFCFLAANDVDHSKLAYYAKTGLIDIPMLTLNDLSYEFVENLIEDSNEHPHKMHSNHRQVSSLESLLLQIHAGIGVALVPEHIARRYADGCSVIPFDADNSFYDIVMFYKKSNQNPVLPVFIDYYHKAVQQNPDVLKTESREH